MGENDGSADGSELGANVGLAVGACTIRCCSRTERCEASATVVIKTYKHIIHVLPDAETENRGPQRYKTNVSLS